MSRDYVKVVLSAYEEKKISGELSPNLLNPTPGNVREECLAIYGKDDKAKDDEVLRLFFSQPLGRGSYFDILENSRAHKFKQVPKILSGQVPKPGLKYVELLAWLIDFPLRPITSYNLSLRDKPKEEPEVGKKLSLEKEKINTDEKDFTHNPDKKKEDTEPVEEIERQPEKSNENNRYKFFLFKKRGFGIVATVILIGFGLFPRYMIWKDDRYEWMMFASEDASVIAIDWDMVRNFRKVMRKDTLTEHSIGKLWYLKENNDHDVFTMGGKHPIFNHRSLHILSPRILDSIKLRVELEKQNKNLDAK